jgi:DNA-binding transcriptional regulator YiaG
MNRKVRTRDLERLARVRILAATGEARKIREESHLSASALGAAIKVSHNAILRWEKGKLQPTGEAAMRYLDVLDALAKILAAK